MIFEEFLDSTKLFSIKKQQLTFAFLEKSKMEFITRSNAEEI